METLVSVSEVLRAATFQVIVLCEFFLLTREIMSFVRRNNLSSLCLIRDPGPTYEYYPLALIQCT